eukprot:TRINITY_DN1869_c0_g1_i3.p1 TRINITY_DN1869_c0_g1~~TRINITY_DN1869_c0_g1_i3.p1  ORF type:complete len:573 (+),score=89.80 TRINITY_DN1869_c0_g1_i3:50-1768(+)
MAHTAHADVETMQERYDPPDVLSCKIDQLVALIRRSKHFVAFTGAGISTSAGIPDFRGPEGKWTLQAQHRQRTGRSTDSICAVPTATHMAIVKLMDEGILKYLISQNCDGLHRRSGVPAGKLSELHGCKYIEYCETCGFSYLRDFHCYRQIPHSRDHFTGRYCIIPGCNGRLMNSTIDFGQDLPERPLKLAFKNSKQADLHLALGSSLTVSPACNMPETTAEKGGALVIVNLQKTPLDDLAKVRIFAKTDDVMRAVMKRLDLEIPTWYLCRRVMLSHEVSVAANCKPWRLVVNGIDWQVPSMPASVFSQVESLVGDQQRTLRQEPFVINGESATLPVTVKLRAFFFGHYREPPVDLSYVINSTASAAMFCLRYDPCGLGVTWQVDPAVPPPLAYWPADVPQCFRRRNTLARMTVERRVLQEAGADAHPSPRMWATLTQATDGGMNFALIGGTARGTITLPQIEAYDIHAKVWVPRVPTAHESESGLPYVAQRRWGHAAVVVPQLSPSTVYLVGGWDNKYQYNDIHTYDLATGRLEKLVVSESNMCGPASEQHSNCAPTQPRTASRPHSHYTE